MSMTPRKARRVRLVILGLVLLAASTVFIIIGIGQGGQFFRLPSEIVETPPRAGQTIRLGGLVKEGSWERGDVHFFTVTDTQHDIRVTYTGIVPDLFDEGADTIVTGHLEGDLFVADEVLAKHDEEYRPAELTDAFAERGIELTN
ncbi:cytochrome c maturation protein CcmE [Pontivivens insulae]|uniref:Cytochrome c-type biogenesis protein CcmE n=1 Tax=Pontivivens insulae TaxID=1639689 RepID=A0A2R8AC71_9RHOB|nr:cytochrome c maturation protein CcmE [Pontivivens insulae]RED13757.1 cytochrome c-type biogenesis protein CcmE [Pontivivens insulae]SPF29831.1 Cytochrome c-type biogenesis protein CcmE [Pontivivens insulae]